MASNQPPEAPPDYPERLRQELEGKGMKASLITEIVDAIADQIRRITRELGSALPHDAETLWDAAHAVATVLPRESNCALDALRIAVRQTEARLYDDHRQQESRAAPGPDERDSLIETLRRHARR